MNSELIQVDLTRILIAAETLMDELENAHHIAISGPYRRLSVAS
jgi:hypothetical protein